MPLKREPQRKRSRPTFPRWSRRDIHSARRWQSLNQARKSGAKIPKKRGNSSQGLGDLPKQPGPCLTRQGIPGGDPRQDLSRSVFLFGQPLQPLAERLKTERRHGTDRLRAMRAPMARPASEPTSGARHRPVGNPKRRRLTPPPRIPASMIGMAPMTTAGPHCDGTRPAGGEPRPGPPGAHSSPPGPRSPAR